MIFWGSYLGIEQMIAGIVWMKHDETMNLLGMKPAEMKEATNNGDLDMDVDIVQHWIWKRMTYTCLHTHTFV